MTFSLNNEGYLRMEQKNTDNPCEITIIRPNEPVNYHLLKANGF